jgi:hypothetical protein
VQHFRRRLSILPQRDLWKSPFENSGAYTREVIGAAPLMFEGYPKYSAAPAAALSEMLRIKAPDDWQAMTTHPRRIMEDPRQLRTT